MRIGRNDPCPCGSGKKFKKCHMGREEELALEQIEAYLPEGAAQKICSLPEVAYGRSKELLARLDLEKLTGSQVGVKFIDLESYLALNLGQRNTPQDLSQVSAGQMINPFKTMEADPGNIYLALSPAVTVSTLIHQLAHVLDYLAGSRNNPALAGPLSMELDIPIELLEHPQEFGYWLGFLKNEFGIVLDAEDTIVDYLHQTGHLIPGQALTAEDHFLLEAHAKRTKEFIRKNRTSIEERIRSREGYQAEIFQLYPRSSPGVDQ